MQKINCYLLLLTFATSFAQKQTDFIDFKTARVSVQPDFDTKSVEGKVTYTFDVLKSIDSVVIDAKNMQFKEVLLDTTAIQYSYKKDQLIIPHTFQSAGSHSIIIRYTATPKKALYFVKDYQNRYQIWTQGQGKYTSNWLPGMDDMNEKIEFDIQIDYQNNYEVIANGKLINKERLNDSITRWTYDMKQPMSSYLLSFVIGTYQKKEELSKSGIPLTMYYYPEDSSRVSYTYKHSKRIFDFLEKEIGYEFPWQNYKQIPVKDFLYAGMENTGTTLFSDAFVVDSIGFTDRNYINVNAHELAHQWFGDLVTETEGKHHWLQEGFATYYALLAEKEIFGSDYFDYKLYESAEQLTAQSDQQQSTSLLDDKANSLTFYQRGAWVLHALRNQIGEKHFHVSIHNYLQKFKYANVSTKDFFTIVKEVSGEDLEAFQKTWLEQVNFPSKEALAILTDSDFIKKYLSLAGERTQPLEGKWKLLKENLDFPVNEYLGQEVVYQLAGDQSSVAISLLEQAFETQNIWVRQAIATSISEIPKELQSNYETLLEDPSYATMEAALYHLWMNFPESKEIYLDKTKNVVGFADKNIRILWLVLALNTPNYKAEKHPEFYRELMQYTHPIQHFSTRENAFRYLESLNIFSEEALLNLAEAAVHHHWPFKKFARKILDSLLKDVSYKNKYVDLMKELPQRQRDYLQTKVTPK